ncbi:MAG TPA: hypothetical protein VFF11_02280, partial [Candidatus Binatia bacterium]|nr:hypothetical protein [Candidatus Binatia bacterium]
MYSPVFSPVVTLLSLVLAGFLPARGAAFYNDWAASHFADMPALADATNDPDGDLEANVVEFAFGTDPRTAVGIAGAVNPRFGSLAGTNGIFSVETLERLGHPPGVQIDLWLSSSLGGSNWFRPWWLRGTTNSLASDPDGSVRETFTTHLPGTNQWFVRAAVRLFDAGVT